MLTQGDTEEIIQPTGMACPGCAAFMAPGPQGRKTTSKLFLNLQKQISQAGIPLAQDITGLARGGGGGEGEKSNDKL